MASRTRCKKESQWFFLKVHLTHDSQVLHLTGKQQQALLIWPINHLGKTPVLVTEESNACGDLITAVPITGEQVHIVLFSKTLTGRVSLPGVTLRFRLSMIFGALSNSFLTAKFNLICWLLSALIKPGINKSIRHESTQHNIHWQLALTSVQWLSRGITDFDGGRTVLARAWSSGAAPSTLSKRQPVSRTQQQSSHIPPAWRRDPSDSLEAWLWKCSAGSRSSSPAAGRDTLSKAVLKTSFQLVRGPLISRTQFHQEQGKLKKLGITHSYYKSDAFRKCPV